MRACSSARQASAGSSGLRNSKATASLLAADYSGHPAGQGMA
jgi:hypothetical protein